MTALSVDASARLHLGMLDPGASLGRRFGGVGVAVSGPALTVEARPSRELSVEGDDSDAALLSARRYLASVGVTEGARLTVRSTVPRHVGLGSGTRLALCVATALAHLHGRPTEPDVLARAVGRGHRSAVGLWTFARGGLVVEGGRGPDRDAPGPLLVRHAVPRRWRCVLVIPDGLAGLSGAREVAAFENLAPTRAHAEQIAHVVLMCLLPALVEGDIREFGCALTSLQRLVGECFRPVQNGCFSHPQSAAVVEALLSWGAAGAGQSSWGPTIFGLAADEDDARELAGRAQRLVGPSGRVEVARFDNRGARVTPLEDVRERAR